MGAASSRKYGRAEEALKEHRVRSLQNPYRDGYAVCCTWVPYVLIQNCWQPILGYGQFNLFSSLNCLRR
ncbi:hypothetical protein Y032_0152g2901 [Ancylostoma ceylanicum]|uniref:Uncharacterized protein n=1 Tax=Ancylostoma ceylanicum TaxID=53326 RepID=A0A016T0L9_9BILA|nr:hypothetical protein Y032_0152g2901 [Ancylostoma ceylanicum]